MLRSTQETTGSRWYYHDSSVFYVMLTLRLGVLGFVLCLFAFELLLQGWIFGDLGQAAFEILSKSFEFCFKSFQKSIKNRIKRDASMRDFRWEMRL